MISGILWNLGIDMYLNTRRNEKYKRLSPQKPIKEDNKIAIYKTFECQDFCVRNNSCFDALGKKRYNVKKDDWKKLLDNKQLMRKTRNYVYGRDKQSDVWAVKDPRNVPFYNLFKQFSSNPKAIVVTRKVESIVGSLRAREAMSHEVATKLVAEHQKMLDAIVADKSNDVLFIRYEYAVALPKETVDRICKFLKLKPTEQQYKSAIDFIDDSLKTF